MRISSTQQHQTTQLSQLQPTAAAGAAVAGSHTSEADNQRVHWNSQTPQTVATICARLWLHANLPKALAVTHEMEPNWCVCVCVCVCVRVLVTTSHAASTDTASGVTWDACSDRRGWSRFHIRPYLPPDSLLPLQAEPVLACQVCRWKIHQNCHCLRHKHSLCALTGLCPSATAAPNHSKDSAAFVLQLEQPQNKIADHNSADQASMETQPCPGLAKPPWAAFMRFPVSAPSWLQLLWRFLLAGSKADRGRQQHTGVSILTLQPGTCRMN
jgi:hypothetical protein